jgi:hypothetical protein
MQGDEPRPPLVYRTGEPGIVTGDCLACLGTGVADQEEREECQDCEGTGSVCVDPGKAWGNPETCYPAEYDECPTCEGVGHVPAGTGRQVMTDEDWADAYADFAYDRMIDDRLERGG